MKWIKINDSLTVRADYIVSISQLGSSSEVRMVNGDVHLSQRTMTSLVTLAGRSE